MPTQAKADQIAEIKSHFKETAGCWFVDSRGLSVKEAQELRRNIREASGRMHVYKNTLAARALAEDELPEIPEILAGPTAFVFCEDDIAAPAKAIKDFAADHSALEFKGGLIDGDVMSVEQCMAIADLPSHNELIAKLMGSLQNPLTGLVRVCNGPVSGLARALKAVAEQKQAA